MLTASVTGAIGVYFLVEEGAATLDIWPFQPAAMLIGAIFFGVGIAILGYCPGTGMAGAGEGSRDAMIGVVGMITGAGILVFGFNTLEPAALANNAPLWYCSAGKWPYSAANLKASPSRKKRLP